MNEDKVTAVACDKQEVMEEQKIEQNEQSEKNLDKIQVKDSQPAVFIPVDRLPEIQVCVHVMCIC